MFSMDPMMGREQTQTRSQASSAQSLSVDIPDNNQPITDIVLQSIASPKAESTISSPKREPAISPSRSYQYTPSCSSCYTPPQAPATTPRYEEEISQMDTHSPARAIPTPSLKENRLFLFTERAIERSQASLSNYLINTKNLHEEIKEALGSSGDTGASKIEEKANSDHRKA